MAGILAWLLARLNDGNFPGTEAWRRRREEITGRRAPSHDAYPTKPHRPRRRLFLAEGPYLEQVELHGYSVEEFLELIGDSRSQDIDLRRLFNALVQANNRLGRRLAVHYAEKAAREAERAELKYERAVAQERVEQRRKGTQ